MRFMRSLSLGWSAPRQWTPLHSCYTIAIVWPECRGDSFQPLGLYALDDTTIASYVRCTNQKERTNKQKTFFFAFHDHRSANNVGQHGSSSLQMEFLENGFHKPSMYSTTPWKKYMSMGSDFYFWFLGSHDQTIFSRFLPAISRP